MKVSVIIPVYNLADYFHYSLSSIINQTFFDMEIIVVDDGSTDDSLKIAHEFTEMDPRIKVIHQNNEGVSVARNTGLRVASGEYILFLDGDDIMIPEAVSVLVDTTEKQKDVILCCGNYERITSYRKEINSQQRGIVVESNYDILKKY